MHPDQTLIKFGDNTDLAQGWVQPAAMDHDAVADSHLSIGRRKDFSNREWTPMNANKRLLIRVYQRSFTVLPSSLVAAMPRCDRLCE